MKEILVSGDKFPQLLADLEVGLVGEYLRVGRTLQVEGYVRVYLTRGQIKRLRRELSIQEVQDHYLKDYEN